MEPTAGSAERPSGPFRRRMLVNTASVGAANGWAMLAALVSLPLVLRGLGAVSFGIWALLQTFSAVGGWFSLLDLGLGPACTREVAHRHTLEDRDGLEKAVGTSVAAHAVLGLASGALLAVVGPWVLPTLFSTPEHLDHEVRVAVVAFSAQVAFDLLCGGCQAVLDGYQRVDRSRLVDIVRRTLVAAGTSVAALSTHRLGAVAIASAVATAVSALAAVVTLAITARGIRPRVARATAGSLFSYGRKVAVLRPLGVIHRSIDRFVVGAILGPASVSLVEVATQLHNGADAVLAASSYAVVPGAARLEAQGNRHKLTELAVSGTRYVLLVTWPVAALIAVLGGPAINLWVGPRYHDAAGLLALALVALAIVAPGQVGSNLLLGTGRAGEILRVALVAIGVNIVGSIVLVNVVGVAGAFQATIAASMVTLPLLLRSSTRELDTSPGELARTAMAPAAPAALLGGGMALLVLAAPLGDRATLAVGGALGVLGAAAGAYRFGLTRDERDRLRSRLRRR